MASFVIRKYLKIYFFGKLERVAKERMWRRNNLECLRKMAKTQEHKQRRFIYFSVSTYNWVISLIKMKREMRRKERERMRFSGLMDGCSFYFCFIVILYLFLSFSLEFAIVCCRGISFAWRYWKLNVLWVYFPHT